MMRANRRWPWPRRVQRGAALLAAMLTVTLVATIAASAVWQQWRNLEVEGAERTRVQAAWLLLSGLDFSRQILRQDARNGGVDSLSEPWSVPLAEARLSTFLQATNNQSNVDDSSIDAAQAFLSGAIVDATNYAFFFGFTFLVGVPVLLLIYLVNKHIDISEPQIGD